MQRVLNSRWKNCNGNPTEPNETQQNKIKSNKIKLNKIKSIYPSNYIPEENKMLTDMMDETEKNEFENIISNSEIILLNPQLYIEIKEILKELYLNPETRKKIKDINSKNIIYALNKFAIANTKTQIQMPKAYFKKCILSALGQTELSEQYDANTIMDQMPNDEGG